MTRLGQAIRWIHTRLDRFALESSIQANAAELTVLELLRPCQLFVLGDPPGDPSVPRPGTDRDILRFDVDDDQGHKHTYMPIFTRRDVVRAALLHNPDWQTLDLLEITASDLLDTRGPDVSFVIDPWSPLEFTMSPETLLQSDCGGEHGSQITWPTSAQGPRSKAAGKGIGVRSGAAARS